MAKLPRTNVIFLAVPVLLLPLTIYVSSLAPVRYFLGLSSEFWAGWLIGLSAVMLMVGLSTLLLKRKPK